MRIAHWVAPGDETSLHRADHYRSIVPDTIESKVTTLELATANCEGLYRCKRHEPLRMYSIPKTVSI